MECPIANCRHCGEEVVGGMLWDICLECFPPYLPTTDSMTCGLCGEVPYCERCSNFNPNECGKCEEGHLISFTGGCSCTYAGDNCSMCAEDNETCESCKLGYLPTEDGTECGKCGDIYTGCMKCRNGDLKDTECAVCWNGMRPPGYSECGTCHVILNCLYCDYVFLNACAECKDSYILTEDDGHEMCVYTGIDHCLEFKDGICTRCEPGYILGYDGLSCGTCGEKDAKCMSCDEIENDMCAKCLDGYVLDTLGTCIAFELEIDPDCVISDGRLCAKCRNGYIVTESGGCGMCGGLCSLCMDAPFEHLCSRCAMSAKSMTQDVSQITGVICCPLNCDKCYNEYGKFCSNGDEEECTEEQYFLSATICTACSNGTLLTPQGFCSERCSEIENCEICDHLTEECARCNEGHYLFNGTCLACFEGFVSNPDRTACVLPSCSEITGCKLCGRVTGTCDACVAGMPVNDKRRCGTCRSACESCDNVNTNLCYKCKDSNLFPSYFGDCESADPPTCIEKKLLTPAIKYPPEVSKMVVELLERADQRCLLCPPRYYQDEHLVCREIVNPEPNCVAWYNDGWCMRCEKSMVRENNGTCSKISIWALAGGFFMVDRIIYICLGLSFLLVVVVHLVELAHQKRLEASSDKKID